MPSPVPSPGEIKAQLEALHDESFGWACHCCGDDPDRARDVLQASYLKVISGKAQFRGDASPKTWFFGVIRLTALELRRKDRRFAKTVAFTDGPQSPEAPGTGHDRRATPSLVRTLLATLAPRQRELIELTVYQGMTLAEAAATLSISPGSASQHYARAKENLRHALASQPALADELRP